ncbi:MAG: NUDIX hydrolase [Planctomycetota bacterium]
MASSRPGTPWRQRRLREATLFGVSSPSCTAADDRAGTTLWVPSIGGMKLGEEPLTVAQKELEEEAGLVAKRWDALGCFAPYKGVSNERCHYFLARELSWTKQHLEPSEAMTVHRMPLAEARARILGQELPDGQSLGGLALLDRFLAGPGSPV